MAAHSSRLGSRDWAQQTQQQPILVAIGLVLVVLWSLAFVQRGEAWLISRPIWNLQDSAEMLRFLVGTAITLAIQCLLYSLLGLFMGTWCRAKGQRNPDGTSVTISRTAISILLFFGALGLALLLRAQPHTNSLDLLGPFVFTGLGYLFGRLCPNLRWALLAATITVLLAAALGLRMGNALLVTEPLALNPPALTSEERVRLTKLIREHNPRGLNDGEIGSIDLTENDINLLLQWGLSLGSANRTAAVNIFDSGALLRASIGVPVPGSNQAPSRFLNLDTSGDINIYDGQLDFTVDEMTLGTWQLPNWLLSYAVPKLVDKVNADPRAHQIIKTVQSLNLQPRLLSATYGKLRLSGLRDDVFGRVSKNDTLKRALRAQFTNIKKVVPNTNSDYSPFTLHIRESFILASRRARRLKTDPVVEVKAALIALSIQFGHSKIASVIPEMESIQTVALARDQWPKVQDRRDLSKHFFASAGITALSTRSLGIDIGRLKEELDAGLNGGSGFSFVDLGADRAGVQLAKQLTRSTVGAKRLMRALTRLENADELIPAVLDLPEGLSLDELEQSYGGTGGTAYQAMVAKIDARIDRLALYAEPDVDPESVE